jgi:hypothetical protein
LAVTAQSPVRRLCPSSVTDPLAPYAATPAGELPPLVSVLVRSTDRPLLGQALASVAAQTHPRIEVVVVAARPGHGPVQATAGVHPLRLLQATEPRPRSLAANVALDAAAGDWLLFLDDDDWLMPEHIARLVAAVQAHPQSLAAYAGVALVDADGTPLGQAFDLPFDAVRLLSGNLTPIHAVLFSRRLLALGCRFDESLDRYEDWDFWIQVARHTVPVHVPGVSAAYRIHDSSGVHEDAGAHSASSQRIQSKWLKQASPEQLGALMQRVWSHDELAHRLEAAQAALQQREAALAEASAATLQALRLELEERRARDAELQAVRADVQGIAAQLQTLRSEWQEQAAAAERRHAETRVQVDAQARELAVQLAQARDRAVALERALAEEAHRSASLQHDNRAMRSSTSWRLTRPLRALMALWRGRDDSAR